MGASISKMMNKIFGSKEMRLLMLGLDAAGKTSTLHSPLHRPQHRSAFIARKE
jgi:GTPase SAR1 family protein